MPTPEQQLTMQQREALSAAADIMDTEREQLAKFLATLGSKLSVREDKICAFGGVVPHRVEIAISNERDRLGKIALTLRTLMPPVSDEE